MSYVEVRRRRPPEERFAGSEHLFDLATIAEGLRAEPGPVTDGHRQIALFHEGGLTLIVYDFEAGGFLADHAADGVVTIQAVSGEIDVSSPEGSHRLVSGSLLVLLPGVRHDVKAVVASQMLLAVYTADPEG
jgi:quercetin dioxygenase-like cupin family protein